MANTIHAVVRLDKMSGTTDGSMLKSVKVATDIDNGNIVKLGSLIEGEREVYAGVTPTTTTELKELVLIATPEVIADETRHHGLEEFYNPANAISRAYRLHSGDIYSATKEAFTASNFDTVAKGWVAVVAASTKPTLKASASSGEVILGKVIAIETAGTDTFYVIEVNL